MIMETVIHAEIQSEDETTFNDRATADHVRGCRIAHGCTHLDIELIWLRASVLVAGCWLVFLVLGIFTDLSLGRFDCVDFIHTHHL